MRTGEVHGLKWKYIDFERRQILVRESIVLGEEDELKTNGSTRDIQKSQIVLDAFRLQHQVTDGKSDYVFCNQAGKPLDNKNFVNRIWAPLLRHLDLANRKAMRHTAATLWLASGEAPELIATPNNAAQAALDEAARQIKNPALRRFFQAATREPEIRLALTSPYAQMPGWYRGKTGLSSLDRFPIQRLQHTARTAGLWCAQSQLERDVHFVATCVLGVQELISSQISPEADLVDVLFTLIRPALHRLDDQHADVAYLLREAISGCRPPCFDTKSMAPCHWPCQHQVKSLPGCRETAP